ncbi:unnamed protein product [Sphagnum jensenii]|uniref:Uncharacterized protein n=1 Tax=Sphagnum jensenii TaxID=128206 RepID=A0ABP1ANU6_9BRYO
MLQVPGESMEEGQRRQFFSLACSSSATTKATSAPRQQIRRMKKLDLPATVYDHDDWMRHRSSTRHAKHLLSVAFSRVILALGPPVMTLTAIAAAITGYNEAVLTHALPLWIPLMQVSSLPFSLTAPALALLLVFRTNASMGGLMRVERPGD